LLHHSRADSLMCKQRPVVEALNLSPPSTGWGPFSGGTASFFCGVQLGRGVQEFRTWNAQEKIPVWNAGLTFTYRRTIDPAYSQEDDLPMTIADSAVLVFSVNQKTGRLFSNEMALGEAYVVLETLEDEQLYDLWLPLRPPTKTWSLEAILEPPPAASVGTLHILIQKSLRPDDGMLAYHGTPSRAIPLRLQPGDLILFSNTELVRHTIKLAQGSEWDHIGIVVSLPEQASTLSFLEAVVDGVYTFRLDHRLDFYRDSAKMAVRRLEVMRTQKMINALAEFALEIRGKPYCSLLDIIKTYGAGAEPSEGTWFCSQLVAAAFQRMDLLAEQPPASAYLPADFISNDQPTQNHASAVDASVPSPPKLQLLQGRLSDALFIPMRSSSVPLQ